MSRTFLLFIFLLSLTAIAVGVAWNNGQIPQQWTDTINTYINPNGTPNNGGNTSTDNVSQTSSASLSSGASPTSAPSNAQKYSGQGPFSSRPFTTSDQWEVGWDSPGPLTVTLCRLDGTPDQVIGQKSDPGPGSSFQLKGGQFYLKISATGPWTAWTAPAGNGAPANPSSQANANSSVPDSYNTSNGDNSSSADYIQKSIVMVRGTRAVGTGFLVKMGAATCVVTNQHVISDNPALIFQTLTGQDLQVVGVQAAVDRDLALITVRDDYGTLPTMPLSTDVADAAKPQDPVVVPGNSQGGDVVVDTPGNIVGIGPIKLEVSNPIYPGNSGSPVVDLKIKQAVGVIAEAEKSDDEGWLNQYSMANSASAIKEVRYYSLRVDDVPAWEKVDLTEYYRQTHLINSFHEQSIELASFLQAVATLTNQQFPSTDISQTLYRRNPKLSQLMDQITVIGNTSAQDNAAKAQQYLFILDGIAETDLSTMNNPESFYFFNRVRAREEGALRKVLADICYKAFNHLSYDTIGH